MIVLQGAEVSGLKRASLLFGNLKAMFYYKFHYLRCSGVINVVIFLQIS